MLSQNLVVAKRDTPSETGLRQNGKRGWTRLVVTGLGVAAVGFAAYQIYKYYRRRQKRQVSTETESK